MIEGIHREENLLALVHRVWMQRKSVALGSGAGILCALLLLVFLIPHYEATMIVSPVVQNGRSGNFLEGGGQRNAGPIDSGGQVGAFLPEEFTRFEQIFREQSVASVLVKYQDIMQKVSEDRSLRFGGTEISSAAELVEYLKDKLTWEPVGASSSRRISYRHPDPEFAVKFLSRVHKITDELIRAQARVETDEQISWIKRELSKTVNPDHRQALAQLLMGEERRRMLISMDRPYAAMVVEPAAFRVRPVSPQRLLLILLASLAGGVAGFFVSSAGLGKNRHG
jgi:uncharacterized protein involved in exopolysaccharide biosynthesis